MEYLIVGIIVFYFAIIGFCIYISFRKITNYEERVMNREQRKELAHLWNSGQKVRYKRRKAFFEDVNKSKTVGVVLDMRTGRRIDNGYSKSLLGMISRKK